MKSKVLLIFCALLTLKSKILANKVTCQYDDIDISIFTTKLSAYSCEISIEFENYENITEVIGEHEEPENTDNDVKILQIFCHSKIQALTSVFCDKFNNLEALKLENIEIKEIEENSIQKCQKLKLLHLNGNEVSEIPEKLLISNPDLVEIVVSSNLLKSLSEDSFKAQEKLQKLFLHNNKIKSLPSGIFKSLKNLKKLNLDDNQIEALDAEWFDNLDSLVTFSINSNKIAHLSPNVFGNLNNLQMLHMDHNLLTILNANFFGTREKLTQICVNSNNISAIDPEIVHNSSLSILRMEFNSCYDNIIESRDQMEEKLKTCFDNFNSRILKQDEFDAVNNATVDADDILLASSTFASIHKSNVYTDDNEPITIDPTSSSSFSTKTTTKIVEISTAASRIAEKPLNCGKADPSIEESDDENKFARGTYPWSVVIMKYLENSSCGGVLISDQKVVTAGKCLYKYDPLTEKIEKYIPQHLMIVLGSHHIHDNKEKDRRVIPISSFHIHNEYDFMADQMDADIAVIELSRSVKFTKYIQPICMMNLGTELTNISEGIVVSYGHTETEKKSSFVPKKIVSKIYENSICPSKNDAFESISSNRTFCGGDSKGKGVCMEDIGSGLFVKHDDHFYLRGIVSVVVGGNEGICDDSTYPLFTDVLKFTKWIEDFADDSEKRIIWNR